MNLWLIAKSNMKRKKGNAVILFVLITLSVMLMYTSMNVLTNVNRYLTEKNETDYGAHVSILATDTHQDELFDVIKNMNGYQECSVYSKLFNPGTGKVKNITNTAVQEETMSVLFGKVNEKHKINNWKIVDAGETFKENSIVVPMFLKVGRGYQTGDEMSIEIGDETKVFEVYGFIEDTMFATPSNITVYSCLVSDEMYQELSENQTLKKRLIYDIRLDSVDQAPTYENEVTKRINERMVYMDFGTNFIMNYETMKGGTMMFTNVLMIILAAFSGIMTLISILVIRFNITSAIKENMANIGIMQAGGYTTRQLKNSYLLEYLFITAAGVVTGLAISGLSGSFIAKIVSQSMGLQWKMPGDVPVAAIVVLFMLLFVSGIVWVSVRRLKHVTTLDALRGGIEAHNFKKNYIPLESSMMGLNSSIGLKNLIHNMRQNLGILAVVTLLSFACVLALTTQYNFSGDSKALLDLVGIEKANIDIMSTQKTEDELKNMRKDLEARADINRAVLYAGMNVTFVKDEKEMSVDTSIFDDFDKLETSVVFKGREAKSANEIVMSNVVANEFGVETGDSITVKSGDHSASYVIVGISQHISNMGKSARFTMDGALRINPDLSYVGIFVYVNQDQAGTSGVISDLKEKYKEDEDVKISNMDESFDSIMGTFTGGLTVLCITFVFITAFVVILIITLIIRMQLLRDKKTLGVFKAIGYTTGQLVWQTVMAIAPVISIGGIIGSILGAFSVNETFVLMLKVCGIEKVNMATSAFIIAGGSIGIIILAFAASAVVSYRIKKIEPYRMIVED